MTYDWDGRHARRIQVAKVLAAIALGLMVPLAVTAWTYAT
jgi:hypothetical protein